MTSRTLRRSAALALIASLALASGASAQAPPIDDEGAEVLRLFDALGLPSVAGLRLVRVNTGQVWGTWADGAVEAEFADPVGWLLEDGRTRSSC